MRKMELKSSTKSEGKEREVGNRMEMLFQDVKVVSEWEGCSRMGRLF